MNTYSENTVNKIKAEDWQNHFKQLFTQQSANDVGQSVENPNQRVTLNVDDSDLN